MPNGCAQRRRLADLAPVGLRSGSTGAIHGAPTASATNSSTTAAPTSAGGRRPADAARRRRSSPAAGRRLGGQRERERRASVGHRQAPLGRRRGSRMRGFRSEYDTSTSRLMST